MRINFKVYFFILSFAIFHEITSCNSTKGTNSNFNISKSSSSLSLPQKETNEINNIKRYKEYIDSMIQFDEYQKYIVRGNAEGTLKQRIVRVSKNGDENSAGTTKEVRTGGFGKYTYSNLKGDSLFKIEYHDNIDKNYYEIFYFRNNKLIVAIIDYQENGIGQTFYKKEEFYNEDIILFSKESKNEIEVKYVQRVKINLRKKGNDFLIEYFKREDKNITR